MPPTAQSKLNTLLASVTLGGMLFTGAFFIAPLRSLPADQKEAAGRLQRIEQQVAVQTSALETLAEVAKDSRDLRRDVDRNVSKIELIQRQLDALHRQP